jgi:capsular exopolysaccharide synthesis family protein
VSSLSKHQKTQKEHMSFLKEQQNILFQGIDDDVFNETIHVDESNGQVQKPELNIVEHEKKDVEPQLSPKKEHLKKKSERDNRRKYNDTFAVNEFIRLFSKLKIHSKQNNLQSFIISSSMVGEGKSTFAANLAQVSARGQESSTLLIDCDMRRPTLHKYFNCSLANGLADILTGGKNPTSVIKNIHDTNLDLVTAGIPNGTPSDLFSGWRMRTVIENFKSKYKMIIMDCPPIIPVSDTILLANDVDGILFVVKAGTTPKRVSQRALELLDDNRQKILGVVINNSKDVLPYYYNNQYYKYKYLSG